jgi:signal transduction histidine kinase
MNPADSVPTANLLIVDDSPANLELLAGLLRQAGYRVRPVPSGELALQAARLEPPDLILLDIDMPGMNGYEVCERLQADERLKGTPVIFISALDDVLDKVKAFAVGGVDYVAKPFQFEEVEARVHTHLTLRRQERQLQASLAQLQALERQRDSLVHMVVHDLRSPLTTLTLLLGMLAPGPQPDPSDMATMLQAAEESTKRMSAMITQLLDISRLEAGQMPVKRVEHDLVQTLRTVLASVAVLAEKRPVPLDAPEPSRATYDEDLLSRVVSNLLTNAFKYTPAGREVRLSVTNQAGGVRVAVTDSGPGIAPEYHQKIFDKFAQTELRHKQVGTGLGLAFCKLAIEAHGGQIGVESKPGHGSTFWFTLPLSSAPR